MSKSFPVEGAEFPSGGRKICESFPVEGGKTPKVSQWRDVFKRFKEFFSRELKRPSPFRPGGERLEKARPSPSLTLDVDQRPEAVLSWSARTKGVTQNPVTQAAPL